VKDTKPAEKSESIDDMYIEIMVEPQNEENIKYKTLYNIFNKRIHRFCLFIKAVNLPVYLF